MGHVENVRKALGERNNNLYYVILDAIFEGCVFVWRFLEADDGLKMDGGVCEYRNPGDKMELDRYLWGFRLIIQNEPNDFKPQFKRTKEVVLNLSAWPYYELAPSEKRHLLSAILHATMSKPEKKVPNEVKKTLMTIVNYWGTDQEQLAMREWSPTTTVFRSEA